ncbi:MAG TPA: hypothetical protein PKD55_26695 [Bellilinea sp.]|nr:hypothetical protein [Bellilinea sp.]
MNANAPDDKPQGPRADHATQEKIREFCYELALALRRITGKVVEDDLDFLGEEKGQPTDTQNETTSEKNSNN